MGLDPMVYFLWIAACLFSAIFWYGTAVYGDYARVKTLNAAAGLSLLTMAGTGLLTVALYYGTSGFKWAILAQLVSIVGFSLVAFLIGRYVKQRRPWRYPR